MSPEISKLGGPGRRCQGIKMNINTNQLAATLIACTICCTTAALALDLQPTDGDPQADAGLAPFYGFGPMEIIKLERSLGTPIIADINGDALNDLIVTNNRKARIELLLQKADFNPAAVPSPDADDEDINDIFGKERTWRFKRVSFPLDVAAACLLVVDLNNDNRLDLAFCAKEGLYVARQKDPSDPDTQPDTDADTEPTAGPRIPRWQTTQKFDLREGLAIRQALAAADLNNDGLTDLAQLAPDGLFILTQQPDGNLAEPIRYHTTGEKLRQLHCQDINGDSLADLIIVTADQDYPLRTRFQLNNGQFGPELRHELPAPTVLELAKLSPQQPAAFLSIAKQSGRLQITQLPPQGQPKPFPVRIYPLPATQSAQNRDVIAADIDADGDLDIIVTDPARAEFLLLRAQAPTGPDSIENFPGFKDMRKCCTGKLGDSPRDAIVALSIEEKLIGVTRYEQGRLTYPAIVSIQGEPQACDLADMNGDTTLDLWYISKDTDEKQEDQPTTTYSLRTILDVGTPAAAPGPQLLLNEIKDKPLDLRAADIDHDGRTDAVIIPAYGPLVLVRQDTPGQLTEVSPKENINAGLVRNVYPNTLALAPLAHDAHGNPQTALLLTQKNFARALTFDPEKGWQVIDQYQAQNANSSLTTAAACQIQPHTPLTIVTYDNALKNLVILAPQPDGTYRNTEQIDIGAIDAQKIFAGNFGTTGDCILVAGTHQLILLPASAPTYTLTEIATFEPNIKDGRYGAVTFADINNDGIGEVILCEQARNHIQILAFDEQAQLTDATKFKVFETPRGQEESGRSQNATSNQPEAAVIGDVTNDQRNDLVLLVHDRIIIYPQN